MTSDGAVREFFINHQRFGQAGFKWNQARTIPDF